MEINELDIACEEIFYLLECGEWDAYEQVSNRFGIDMVKLYNHYQDLYVKGSNAMVRYLKTKAGVGSSRNSRMPYLGPKEFKKRKLRGNITDAMFRMHNLVEVHGEDEDQATLYCSRNYYLSQKWIQTMWQDFRDGDLGEGKIDQDMLNEYCKIISDDIDARCSTQ